MACTSHFEFVHTLGSVRIEVISDHDVFTRPVSSAEISRPFGALLDEAILASRDDERPPKLE
jgi:hypothetical protein